MTHNSIQNNQLVQLKEKTDNCSSLNIGPTFNLLLCEHGAFSRKKRLFPENKSYEAWLDGLIVVLLCYQYLFNLHSQAQIIAAKAHFYLGGEAGH